MQIAQLDYGDTDNPTALAIFVKTPGLSPVKTRLAATLGQEKAEELFLLCIRAIAAVAKQAQLQTQNQPSEIIPYWAIAEAEALDHPLWQNFSRLHTGAGNLGQRLDRVYRALRANHQRVILIGADSPQLTAQLLVSAATGINAKKSVICPTHDGGYALFGSQSNIPTSAWVNTPYSSAKTTNVFLRQLLPMIVIKLPPIGDIDHEADVLTICQEMRKIDLLPEQVELVDWCQRQLNLNLDLDSVHE
ncbi:Protein of unknown function DUF2064 [Thalassoporum mexicanum PCC 7367]|uniref:TIGR04282 family arsenosugar biosynthesis glycosyltransferase n=1 Tax=Thalassoporum mexicanum TaxID=3457544 RepID=UPI00029F9D52|nr:DUF2064 domain-containing protein [Pseudanabaena sp. PCC 7367]AFY68671.1 Protein of unknown function DUF2064 [Pseudanabaena sp. PCC 7367]